MTSKRPVPYSVPLPSTQARQATDWRATGPSDHFVQFYRTDEYLIECLAGYLADGIWKDECAIVIATPEHRIALEERLRQKGIDLISCMVRQQFVSLDAREMLSKFMVGDSPDAEAFEIHVGGLVEHAKRGGRAVRAFGEMVALLWAAGNRQGAVKLEQLWNDLGRRHTFALYCAYPAGSASDSVNGVSLTHICDAHSCVISMAG